MAGCAVLPALRQASRVGQPTDRRVDLEENSPNIIDREARGREWTPPRARGLRKPPRPQAPRLRPRVRARSFSTSCGTTPDESESTGLTGSRVAAEPSLSSRGEEGHVGSTTVKEEPRSNPRWWSRGGGGHGAPGPESGPGWGACGRGSRGTPCPAHQYRESAERGPMASRGGVRGSTRASTPHTSVARRSPRRASPSQQGKRS